MTSTERYKIRQTFEYNKDKGPFEKVQNQNSKIKKALGKYGIEADFFGFKTKLPVGVVKMFRSCNERRV